MKSNFHVYQKICKFRLNQCFLFIYCHPSLEQDTLSLFNSNLWQPLFPDIMCFPDTHPPSGPMISFRGWTVNRVTCHLQVKEVWSWDDSSPPLNDELGVYALNGVPPRQASLLAYTTIYIGDTSGKALLWWSIEFLCVLWQWVLFTLHNTISIFKLFLQSGATFGHHSQRLYSSSSRSSSADFEKPSQPLQSGEHRSVCPLVRTCTARLQD